MISRREAHDHLTERLGLPEYYGRNLDGLYDLLTEPLPVRPGGAGRRVPQYHQLH